MRKKRASQRKKRFALLQILIYDPVVFFSKRDCGGMAMPCGDELTYTAGS